MSTELGLEEFTEKSAHYRTQTDKEMYFILLTIKTLIHKINHHKYSQFHTHYDKMEKTHAVDGRSGLDKERIIFLVSKKKYMVSNK